MADLDAIRDRLKTRLDTVSGLHAHRTMPEQVPLFPAAVVFVPPGEFVTEVTMDGAEDVRLVVLVLVKKVVADEAQGDLDAFASAGSLNVSDAIDSGSTADWDYAVCGAARDYGDYVFGAGEQAQSYLGYQITVTIGVSP